MPGGARSATFPGACHAQFEATSLALSSGTSKWTTTVLCNLDNGNNKKGGEGWSGLRLER